MVVKLENFLNLADSAKFASLLALLEEVDTLEGVRVLKQVKSQNSGASKESKTCHPAS